MKEHLRARTWAGSQHAHADMQSLIRQHALTSHIRTNARGLKHARTTNTQRLTTK